MDRIEKHPDFDIYVSTSGAVFNSKMVLKKLSTRYDGYLVTSVGGRGIPIRRVHHLVLETFVGPCPEGMETRHLNGDPSDNRLENLAWGSREDQISDQKKHGTFSKPPVKKGRDNPRYAGVFDGERMSNALSEYKKSSISLRELSRIHGVSRTHLRRQISKLGVCKEV